MAIKSLLRAVQEVVPVPNTQQEDGTEIWQREIATRLTLLATTEVVMLGKVLIKVAVVMTVHADPATGCCAACSVDLVAAGCLVACLVAVVLDSPEA